MSLRELEEKLEQVVVSDEQHQGNENREAYHLSAFPQCGAEWAALEFLDQQEKYVAPIQGRDGQEVEDAKLEADDRGEKEKIGPATFGGFSNHLANPERPAHVIHRTLAGNHLSEEGEGRLDDVQQPPHASLHRLAKAEA